MSRLIPKTSVLNLEGLRRREFKEFWRQLQGFKLSSYRYAPENRAAHNAGIFR